MFTVRRSIHNPILNPERHVPWEAFATFNWSPVKKGNKTLVAYRAMSEVAYHEGVHLRLSTIGVASSTDGAHFKNRKQLIVPQEPWERFGCEDPRVCKVGRDYYIFYTALSNFPFNAEGIRTAVAVSSDLAHIKERHLVTPFNSKAMSLFPEKIGGKFMAILAAHTDSPPAKIVLASFNKLEDMWSPEYWQKWHEKIDSYTINLSRADDDQIEIGAPPIKTDRGWLLVYAHIQHYGKGDVVFGIEAALLDLKNPQKIIGRTKGPFITAEETYERYGQVPNIVFPSGALIVGKDLRVYYGASDTTCCCADINLGGLLDSMIPGAQDRLLVNPIISASQQNPWGSRATYNPTAIDLGGRVHILYRAQALDNTSTIGYASSKNGLTVDERLSEPIYVPRADFERKGVPGGNSGCEDPRLSKIGSRIYMCYTAYNGVQAPAVAVTSISERDFLARRWDWTPPVLVTPGDTDDKDACIFPEKVGGKYLIFHRLDNSISADFVSDLNFVGPRLGNRMQLMAPRPGMWDSNKVGIAAPPIKTEKGWLLLYHGVSQHGIYRVGVALLDKRDPTQVIERGAVPILSPHTNYEKVGQVNNVVFPCGMIVRKGVLYVYYGGADLVVAVATAPLKRILATLS